MVTADLKITRTHAFFMIMGGFHYFKGSPDKEGAPCKAVHPLRYRDVIAMLKDDTISLPPEEELRDRNKSHWLVKIIVLLQALWFVAQCIARGIKNSHTTQLELVTFAYTFINLGVFIAWRDKPRNVDHPIRVFQKPVKQKPACSVEWMRKVWFIIVGLQDDLVELHKRTKVPMFYSGKPHVEEVAPAGLIALFVSMVLGAIHCIAWSFDFGSDTELFLWRISSIVITAIPVLFILAFIVAGLALPEEPLTTFFQKTIFNLSLAPFPLVALLYVAARLTTLVLAFMNLASFPHGVSRSVY
jgi:hypothetical protein